MGRGSDAHVKMIVHTRRKWAGVRPQDERIEWHVSLYFTLPRHTNLAQMLLTRGSYGRTFASRLGSEEEC